MTTMMTTLKSNAYGFASLKKKIIELFNPDEGRRPLPCSAREVRPTLLPGVSVRRDDVMFPVSLMRAQAFVTRRSLLGNLRLSGSMPRAFLLVKTCSSDHSQKFRLRLQFACLGFCCLRKAALGDQ